MNKKAQVKFGESIGVIFIVFIVLMSGMIWYNKINTQSLNKIHNDNQNDLAFEKYYYLKELDLIHVSKRGIVEKELDLNSLLVFEDYSKSNIGKEYLRNRLGFAEIKISIYDNQTSLKLNSADLNITLYNNTPKSSTVKIKEPIIFITYVPVVDNNKKTKIAKLNVKSYILE